MKFAVEADVDLGTSKLSPPAKSAALPASVVPRNSRRLTPWLFPLEFVLTFLLLMRRIFIISLISNFSSSRYPSSSSFLQYEDRSRRCFWWYRRVYRATYAVTPRG